MCAFYQCYACGKPNLHGRYGNMNWVSADVNMPLCKGCVRKAWREHARDNPECEFATDRGVGMLEYTIFNDYLNSKFQAFAVKWAREEREFNLLGPPTIM